MKERELRAVAEAISECDFESDSCEAMAQAAISSSDSQYVKGLVEALKMIAINPNPNIRSAHNANKKIALDAICNLPEDRR